MSGPRVIFRKHEKGADYRHVENRYGKRLGTLARESHRQWRFFTIAENPRTVFGSLLESELNECYESLDAARGVLGHVYSKKRTR